MIKNFTNFFSKLTFKQNLIILLISIIIISIACYSSYKYYNVCIANDQIKTNKIKNNMNKTYNYLKTNNFINTQSVPVTLVKEMFNIEDNNQSTQKEKIISLIKDKYSSYITDDFFIETKLKKLKSLNYEKNKNLDVKKIGLGVLQKNFKKLFQTSKIFSDEKGCLLFLNDEEQNILYLDFYVEIGNNKGIGFIFSPFYKVCYYPNSYYATEEEFLIQRHTTNTLINKAFLNGVYIFEIPEKLYNLHFDEYNDEWVYKEVFTEEEEKDILNNEELYFKYMSEYIFNKIKSENEKYKMFVNSIFKNKQKLYF